ncbi:hypothetical protein EMCG_01879 [[Emmonsia] crescens]|uniref:Uncharacterized protein n=1 Tax=[Emmonsia] crescens TaxID=73230 RepID=A0A0G2I0V9_9EURO|nr:hypothetical protein EMCG_01879 [Emmonsia crescens UAMH 3008]
MILPTELCHPSSIESLQDHRLNMPSSESSKHGPLSLHDLVHHTSNSSQIGVCNTQDLTALLNDLPLLDEDAAEASPSLLSIISLNGSLEEFL